MALTITLNKGKKRAIEPPTDIITVSSGSEPPHPTKRAKKSAETRQCPICDERVPLRLLGRHAELEAQRVEGIIQKVGSFEVVYDDIDEPGPSSRARRSAIKARQSITTHNVLESIGRSNKTIQIVKRNRKQRQTKLKEMMKDDDEFGNAKESWLQRFTGEEITCPVCSATVRGDQDVVDAHVDACLAHESQRMEEARLLELQQAEDEEGWDGGNNYVGNVRGAGFSSIQEEGIDEDIDIDGDDQAIFGDVQFTEKDVVPLHVQRPDVVDEDVEVEIEESDAEDHETSTSLRHLVAARKVVKRVDAQGTARKQMDEVMGVSEIDQLDLAIVTARQRSDKNALVLALENKLKQLESATVFSSTSLLCRICIDPYTEPTVSTGCWHTCCRECWLRCLGSTKLCPICKRITSATDLRRVYI